MACTFNFKGKNGRREAHQGTEVNVIVATKSRIMSVLEGFTDYQSAD